MRLFWARPALEDRAAIRDYIAEHNPTAALEMDGLISAKATLLTERPFIGRPGRVDGTRELVVHKNYILIYDIIETNIRVLRVLHTARKWPS